MIMKKLLAIFFMFMCFAASASTLVYNTQSPYPPPIPELRMRVNQKIHRNFTEKELVL